MKPTLLRKTGEFPPSGYPFQDPITGKSYRDMGAGFEVRVAQIVNDRLANKRLITNQNQVSPSAVSQELSEYVCEQLRGNPRYCTSVGVRASASVSMPAPFMTDKACKFCGKYELRRSVCVSCGGKVSFVCNSCGKTQK